MKFVKKFLTVFIALALLPGILFAWKVSEDLPAFKPLLEDNLMNELNATGIELEFVELVPEMDSYLVEDYDSKTSPSYRLRVFVNYVTSNVGAKSREFNGFNVNYHEPDTGTGDWAFERFKDVIVIWEVRGYAAGFECTPRAPEDAPSYPVVFWGSSDLPDWEVVVNALTTACLEFQNATREAETTPSPIVEASPSPEATPSPEASPSPAPEPSPTPSPSPVTVSPPPLASPSPSVIPVTPEPTQDNSLVYGAMLALVAIAFAAWWFTGGKEGARKKKA